MRSCCSQSFSLSCACAGAQTVTVPLAFTAVQQALAAIHFESKLSEKPAATLSDPGRCLPSAITGQTVMANFVRHLKYACFTYNRSCIGSQLPCKQTATVCVAVSFRFLCLLGTKMVAVFNNVPVHTKQREHARTIGHMHSSMQVSGQLSRCHGHQVCCH